MIPSLLGCQRFRESTPNEYKPKFAGGLAQIGGGLCSLQFDE